MNNFGSIVAAELQAFSAELLEPGIAPSKHVNKSLTSSSTIRSTNHQSRRLSQMVPALLRELAPDSDGNEIEFITSRSPKRAKASRAPQDYALAGSRLVPTKWDQSLSTPQRPELALRWLSYVLQKQMSVQLHAKTRMQKYVEDANQSLQGVSVYAEDNLQALSQALSDCESTLTELRKATSSVANISPSRIRPSPSLPVPYPQEPSWQIFRRLAKEICSPEVFIGTYINEVCGAPILAADLPYLYQRWVALKFLQCMERVGWNTLDDPVGAIWLGGKLQFSKGAKRITAWIEPRLMHMRFGEHPSKFFAKDQPEKTPDFLIVAHKDSGDEAFVLDATISKSPQILVNKGKYLADIESSTYRSVAGVSLKRFPLRSWAASPIPDLTCRILDNFGHVGVIPMDPIAWNSNPFEAWIGDLIAIF